MTNQKKHLAQGKLQKKEVHKSAEHSNKKKKNDGSKKKGTLQLDGTWSTSVNTNQSKSSRGSKENEGSDTKQKGGLSAMQAAFKKKLEGAKFRMINETLYTSRGEESFETFQSDPKLFDIYHEGFREQASHWPDNPLTIIINWLKTKHPKAVIADLGAGDAELAQSLSNKVHSFDLVSKNSRVVAADIAKLPLTDSSVDIAVFCLSLMGTNIGDFLKEAYRILKPKGIMKIAEVRSRFEGEADGMKKFMRILKRAGFDITEKPSSNKMFFILECAKSERSQDISDDYSAKACVYKKR
jgi:ribosomal RNA-processing protein 8